MSFITRDWARQRRNVNRLSRFVRNKKIEEARLRQEFGRRSYQLFARTETMLMIGVTGAVWTSRLKDAEEPRPLKDLVISMLIVRRWDRLAHRISSKRASE